MKKYLFLRYDEKHNTYLALVDNKEYIEIDPFKKSALNNSNPETYLAKTFEDDGRTVINLDGIHIPYILKQV